VIKKGVSGGGPILRGIEKENLSPRGGRLYIYFPREFFDLRGEFSMGRVEFFPGSPILLREEARGKTGLGWRHAVSIARKHSWLLNGWNKGERDGKKGFQCPPF